MRVNAPRPKKGRVDRLQVISLLWLKSLSYPALQHKPNNARLTRHRHTYALKHLTCAYFTFSSKTRCTHPLDPPKFLLCTRPFVALQRVNLFYSHMSNPHCQNLALLDLRSRLYRFLPRVARARGWPAVADWTGFSKGSRWGRRGVASPSCRPTCSVLLHGGRIVLRDWWFDLWLGRSLLWRCPRLSSEFRVLVRFGCGIHWRIDVD